MSGSVAATRGPGTKTAGRRAGHAVLGNARIVVNVGAGGTDQEMWKVAGDFCHASAMCLALAKLNHPSADFCV